MHKKLSILQNRRAVIRVWMDEGATVRSSKGGHIQLALNGYTVSIPHAKGGKEIPSMPSRWLMASFAKITGQSAAEYMKRLMQVA